MDHPAPLARLAYANPERPASINDHSTDACILSARAHPSGDASRVAPARGRGQHLFDRASECLDHAGYLRVRVHGRDEKTDTRLILRDSQLQDRRGEIALIEQTLRGQHALMAAGDKDRNDAGPKRRPGGETAELG